MAATRQPVVFIPHGGGPWPFVEMGFPPDDVDKLAGYLRSVRHVPPVPPRALLVVSAHWEAPVATVMTAERPPMLYDYYGFPPESYTLTWPAPGSPPLAARTRTLLEGAGFATAADPSRGYDHGTFVPLKLTYPEAEVPAVQLSLKEGLDPAEHIAIGRALQPLRDEGVFIVAQGLKSPPDRDVLSRVQPLLERELHGRNVGVWIGELQRHEGAVVVASRRVGRGGESRALE